jgi:glyoxylase-like metal-dependent hydrolase (beta-lactamase superfamily II)
MRITGLAQHEAWQAKSMPPIEQVRTGLWSVPVPIPHSPLRYTLTYLLISDRDVVVVDPGWDTDPSWQALGEGLQAAGAEVDDVTGIVVSHVHPDHHGLSSRLRQASGAWVAMHPAERDSLPARVWDDHLGPDQNQAWLRRSGVPDDIAAELSVSTESLNWVLTMAEPDVLLEHGDLVPVAGRTIRAVHTPGHTPGHLCLHEETEDVLLTGDHVLPRISPNIGLQPHSATPPLAAYLNSLAMTAGYDSAEALPAHEYRFHGLAERTRDLRAHHAARCQEIIEALEQTGPATAWAVTEQLTWSRGWAAVSGMMRRAALAETAAHLDYLIGRGQVLEKPGDIAEYTATGIGAEAEIEIGDGTSR